MDESEKRRERLKAMRSEAAQSELSNDVWFPPNPASSNPLMETYGTPSFQQEESRATQRFGFYTDPMAAFSANKKRSHDIDHSIPHYNPPSGATTPDHAHHHMHQSQGPYTNPAHHGNPRGMPMPFPMYQGTLDVANNYNPGPYSNQMANPFPTYQRAPEAPNLSGGYGGAVVPAIGPGHGSSRGRGNWNRGGGRGSNFHSSGSGWQVGPEQFYDKSMVEDPWQYLEPVLWKDLHDTFDSWNNPNSSNSWLPNSITGKKAKVLESYNNSSGRPSLAEYLASAFEEAADNKPSG